MTGQHVDTATGIGLGRRLTGRSSQDFAQVEREGLILAAKVRLGLLLVVVSWLAIDLPMSGAAYAYELGVIGLYMLTGFAHLMCARREILLPYSVYALFAIDVAFMGWAFSHANPFVDYPQLSPAVFFVIPNFKWFMVILVQAAFALTPRLVIWCGLCIVIARAAQFGYVWSLGDFYSEASLTAGDWQAWTDAWHDPNFLSVQARVFELIFIVGMTAGLAAIVRRSRKLVLDRVRTERARASLARYFSPNVVDAVSDNPEELDRTRVADVAVMFVDIKGFTSSCEHMKPDEIADLLREFYRRLTDAVFAHKGTLDKFLGDGVMATFGTPVPRHEAAADALACGIAIADDIAAWNESRRSQGNEPVSIGIGVHYGPALIGNIGDERRLEYAVVGDTVNVASRVEGLTRQLDTHLAITDDCVTAVRRTTDHPDALLDTLTSRGEFPVKGREGSIQVWAAT